MYALNFEYAGEQLSDYGMIICSFDSGWSGKRFPLVQILPLIRYLLPMETVFCYYLLSMNRHFNVHFRYVKTHVWQIVRMK